jgi:YesN/AraC family two-component response regulator
MLAARYELSLADITARFQSEAYIAYLEAIGLPLDNSISAEKRDHLTEKQLRVINAIMNTSDRRSKTKILNDFSVSAGMWATWQRDPVVSAYMRERAESLIGDAAPVAAKALVENIENGDQRALEYWYELTGRYRKNADSTANVQQIMVTVMETIQKHVKNPETLRAIAEDFGLLAKELDGPVVPIRLEA